MVDDNLIEFTALGTQLSAKLSTELSGPHYSTEAVSTGLLKDRL